MWMLQDVILSFRRMQMTEEFFQNSWKISIGKVVDFYLVLQSIGPKQSFYRTKIFWSGLIIFGLNQNGLFSTDFFLFDPYPKSFDSVQIFFTNYPKEGQFIKKQIVLILSTDKTFEFQTFSKLYIFFIFVGPLQLIFWWHLVRFISIR